VRWQALYEQYRYVQSVSQSISCRSRARLVKCGSQTVTLRKEIPIRTAIMLAWPIRESIDKSDLAVMPRNDG
jgi:hypothetical protein